MPYFINAEKSLFYLDSENDDVLLPDGCRKITNAEAAKILHKPPTIPGLLSERKAAINAECERRTAAVRADTPADEVQSWGKQEQEARALLADAMAATPLLSAIAAARGVPLPLLAEKVVDKSDAYAAYTGALIGTRQALEDRLAAIDLTAPDALAQIDAVQWPEA